MADANQLLRKAAAEAIGTFTLVFAGCGAIVVNAQSGALGHVGVCLTFGLVVAGMIFATGHVSGAHLNPAVTVAFASTGAFPWRQVPAYVAAQLGAALLGSLAIAALIGTDAHLGATLPAQGLAQAVALEALFTAVLMFVIQSVATDARASGQLAAVAIGGTVALLALMGGPLTGASMNPARSLGPALVSGELTGAWLYVVGPVLGALGGAGAYRVVACGPVEGKAQGCC